MIITRSPLRITLGGGGTDLPSYYNKFGGFLISAAINKYVYTSVLEPYANGIYLKYSKREKTRSKHEILYEKCNHEWVKDIIEESLEREREICYCKHCFYYKKK